LATPPTPEFVSFAFAMTEDQSAKTIISLIGCMTAVQIHTAKCVSTWLAPDFRADPSSPCTRDWSISAHALHRTLLEADQFRTIATPAIEAFKSAVGTPRTKVIADLLCPVVAPYDAIITFGHDVFKAMTTRVQQKITAILIDGAAGLKGMYPQDWDTFALAASRDDARVRSAILRNPKHKELRPAADNLEKKVVLFRDLAGSIVSVGAIFSDVTAKIENTMLYLAIAGILNLVVNKKLSKKFTNQDCVARLLGGCQGRPSIPRRSGMSNTYLDPQTTFEAISRYPDPQTNSEAIRGKFGPARCSF